MLPLLNLQQLYTCGVAWVVQVVSTELRCGELSMCLIKHLTMNTYRKVEMDVSVQLQSPAAFNPRTRARNRTAVRPTGSLSIYRLVCSGRSVKLPLHLLSTIPELVADAEKQPRCTSSWYSNRVQLQRVTSALCCSLLMACTLVSTYRD
jgi:hypothetical protein